MQSRLNGWVLAGCTLVPLALLILVHFTGLPTAWQQILQVGALLLMAVSIELYMRSQRVTLLHSQDSQSPR